MSTPMSLGEKGLTPTRETFWTGIVRYLADVYRANRFRIDSFVVSIALKL